MQIAFNESDDLKIVLSIGVSPKSLTEINDFVYNYQTNNFPLASSRIYFF